MDDDFDNDPDDIFSLTDSGESSNSSSNQGPFDARTPLVMQMHELTRDEPSENRIRSPKSAPESNVKVKKLKKKKRTKHANERRSASSSSSGSSTAEGAAEETPQEEFYDTVENNLIPEHKPTNPVASAALVLAHSVHEQNPKTAEIKDQTEPAQTTLPMPDDTRRQPSTTITKPVTRSN